MSLYDQLKSELVTARTDKNEIKTNLLRTMIGDLQNLEKRIKSVAIDDDLVFKTIRSYIKNIDISLGQSDKNSQVLNAEKDILNSYLPELLSEEDIQNIVTENGFTSPKDAIPYFKINYSGRYDSRIVIECLKKGS